MFDLVKKRCGVADAVNTYDDDITSYIEDCKEEMLAAGVPQTMIDAKNDQVVTAVTLYVKAYIGDDRQETEKYLDLYRKKVFRLTLEGEDE